MIGVIVAGRLVQTDFQQVDQTHIVFSLNHAELINHIIIFLTGQVAFPDNYAGAVYFSLPNENTSASWQYLGFISNEKPSAIFKVSKLKNTIDTTGNICDNVPNVTMFGDFHRQDIAQIGISVEPLEIVKNLTEAAGVNATSVENFVEFTQKMLENFVNFASSFAVSSNEALSRPSESFVPTSVVQKWFDNFKRRLNVNPYFWKN